ncbi:MAG: hypothetical protein KIS81_06915 [Maricaulaceae bacterium]|nr:hypothetical protein [Maricaulaceae bacterium]
MTLAASTLASETRRHAPRAGLRPLRAVMFGCGVVGGGVMDGLQGLPGLKLAAVVTRLPRPGTADGPRRLIDATDAFGLAPDLVIEALPDIALAEQVLERAIEAGAAVVSANKAVVARRPDLEARARAQGTPFLYSAAVGGGVPVLETLHDLRRRGRAVTGVRGVANGTSNFVLDRLATGESLASAVAAAQAAGFAEADPSADLDGRDAAAKLALIARACDVLIDPRSIPAASIRDLPNGAAAEAARRGLRLRQVAELALDAHGPAARILLRALPGSDPLARTQDEENCFVLHLRDGETLTLTGKGAGRGPTAASVLGDVGRVLSAWGRR